MVAASLLIIQLERQNPQRASMSLSYTAVLVRSAEMTIKIKFEESSKKGVVWEG